MKRIAFLGLLTLWGTSMQAGRTTPQSESEQQYYLKAQEESSRALGQKTTPQMSRHFSTLVFESKVTDPNGPTGGDNSCTFRMEIDTRSHETRTYQKCETRKEVIDPNGPGTISVNFPYVSALH